MRVKERPERARADATVQGFQQLVGEGAAGGERYMYQQGSALLLQGVLQHGHGLLRRGGLGDRGLGALQQLVRPLLATVGREREGGESDE